MSIEIPIVKIRYLRFGLDKESTTDALDTYTLDMAILKATHANIIFPRANHFVTDLENNIIWEDLDHVKNNM